MNILLAQLPTVKARLGLLNSDTTDDAILTNAISAISDRFSNECNRFFCRQAAAQHVFRADEMDLRVDRYPIESVATFELKTRQVDGWVLVAGADVPDYNIGPLLNVIELSAPLGLSSQLGRITYAGGYVLPGTTPGAGQIALPADLEQAVVEQCTYWYQRRSQLGLVSVSGDGGSIAQFRTLDLLPNVVAVAKQYERLLL